MDVYVGSVFALVASIYAISRGATLIGSTIAAIVIFQIIFYSIIFLIPALRGIPAFPKPLFKVAEYFVGGSKAKILEQKSQPCDEDIFAFCSFDSEARCIADNTQSSCLDARRRSSSGLSLWVILQRTGLNIDLLSSIVVSFGVSTIAIIPISIGGSGVAELAMHSYLSSVFGFNSWTAVIIWRIVSFQFLLIPTSIAFLILMRKITKPKSAAQQKITKSELEPEKNENN